MNNFSKKVKESCCGTDFLTTTKLFYFINRAADSLISSMNPFGASFSCIRMKKENFSGEVLRINVFITRVLTSCCRKLRDIYYFRKKMFT